MTFEQYWNKLQLAKPVSEGSKVTLTKGQFKKVLLDAFSKGFNQGTLLIRDNTSKANDVPDFIKDLFGGLK